jgi:serine/threonine-protein kinase
MVGRDIEDGSPIIVMKRVEGVTWSDVLADPNKAPAAEHADLDYHLRVLIQLCHALRFAHSAGVVHLDIKPANVMLGAFGEVYLADWGIATRLGPGIMPPPGSIRGTPSFMAPEMADPENVEVDVRTDVFLLGATLHRVITGQRLHDGKTPMDTVKMAMEYKGLRIDGAEVDPELAEITTKAVAANPENRYQSVDAFQQAVQSYLSHRESYTLARIAERGIEAIQTTIAAGNAPNSEQLTETRFALRRALDIWPESPEANSLRDQLGRTIFDWALANDDVKEAERAAASVQTDRDDVVERLEAALERLRKEREELELLRSRRDQLTGYRTRIVVGGGAMILWGLIAGYKAWNRWDVPLDEVDPNYLPSLIPTFGIPLILIVVFWKSFFTTEFNRRVLVFFLGGISAVASIRIIGWVFDLPAYVATATEFLMYATLGVLFGAFTDFRLSAASLILVFAAALAVVFPHYQYGFMCAACALFAPYVVWLWAQAGREPEAS